MTKTREISFSSAAARLQYLLLMGLFRLAVTRALYGRFARGLGQLFNPDNAVFLRIGDAPPYRIALNDGYWTRFALYHHPYEPEVEAALEAARGHTSLFCDLGANKGYWTTRGAAMFARVIAVEASGATYRDLARNADALPNVALHRAAIHARSGETLTFLNTHLSHASARLLGTGTAGQDDRTETVTTLAIDDLVPAGTAALIKLDVEGAEVAAMDGAARALKDGSVLIYEDHGNDSACTPSAHLIGLDNMRLFAIEGGVMAMPSIKAIRALKTDPYKGYNFLAARADSPLLAAIIEGFAMPGQSR
ncbi:FkbM family methyltransferase [uncultured Roseovarius sp.]|uniref:FkbM family methyltransferase n=1 Tax=uncultured Roseovarius sp. TaxID=293344 RepID=UPI0025E33034|nr:FkbM family methyltransferase [uncultured Roseovarius sp.]